MKEYSKSAFVADVIKALEDAERASQQNQKDKGTLARDAYSKLQYDYPLVSQHELLALTESICSKEPWAVLSDRILTVLYDCVSRGSSKTGGTAPSSQQQEPGPSTSTATAATAAEDLEADALLASFQKLYILFILSTMTDALLQATPEAASQILSQLTAPAAATEGAASAGDPLNSNLQSSFKNLEEGPSTHLNDIEMDGNTMIIDVTEDMEEELVDNGVYEPLEGPTRAPSLVAGMAAAMAASPPSISPAVGVSDSSSSIIEVISKLLYLSSKLSYHVVSSSAAWQDGILRSSLEKCLTALRQHPSFIQLLPAAGAACSLLHDRCVHSGNPLDYEAAMKAIVNGLDLLDPALNSGGGGKTGGDKITPSAAMLLGLETAASLSKRLPQGPSRRKLWTHIDEFWLKVAAGMLEQMEATWRQQQKKKNNNSSADNTSAINIRITKEDIHIIAISSLLTEFYILEAAVVVKIDNIQEVLLSTGLFRGLVLSFINYGQDTALDSLRRALLICCASSPVLSTWAKAVPGFSNAWEHSEFAVGGCLERYGAVHAAFFGLPGGDQALASVLLLGKISAAVSFNFTAEDVPEVYTTLQLLESVQKARDRAGKGGKESGEVASFLSGAKTVAALESLSSSLRALKAELDDAAGEMDKESIIAESEQAEKAREEEKLALSTEAQAEKLAARRAKLLQPECLRMIKRLRSKPGSVGKSD